MRGLQTWGLLLRKLPLLPQPAAPPLAAHTPIPSPAPAPDQPRLTAAAAAGRASQTGAGTEAARRARAGPPTGTPSRCPPGSPCHGRTARWRAGGWSVRPSPAGPRRRGRAGALLPRAAGAAQRPARPGAGVGVRGGDGAKTARSNAAVQRRAGSPSAGRPKERPEAAQPSHPVRVDVVVDAGDLLHGEAWGEGGFGFGVAGVGASAARGRRAVYAGAALAAGRPLRLCLAAAARSCSRRGLPAAGGCRRAEDTRLPAALERSAAAAADHARAAHRASWRCSRACRPCAGCTAARKR